jgi:Na+-transporting NADH:ubiquinone oxidoreductase subunit C
MKNFSNKYIFLYSIVLVAIVAILLSVVATGLKSKQQANVRNEKMQSLLAAINVRVERDDAAKVYRQYFTQELNVTTAGETIDIFDVVADKQTQGSVRPFDVNLKEQQTKSLQGDKKAVFPVYCYTKDGKTGYVLPMRGTGLWGAVWGYIAIAQDCNMVEGVTFDHEGETPGLGAEITTEKFQKPFLGKQILDDKGKVVSIAVKKHADKEGKHEVDAITGGTMTSNGVSAMLATDMARYQMFFDKVLSSTKAAGNTSNTDVAQKSDKAGSTTVEGKEVK